MIPIVTTLERTAKRLKESSKNIIEPASITEISVPPNPKCNALTHFFIINRYTIGKDIIIAIPAIGNPYQEKPPIPDMQFESSLKIENIQFTNGIT